MTTAIAPVACTHFTSVIYEDEHWDDSGRQTTYACLTWGSRLPVEDRLPIEVLKANGLF